MDQLVIAGVLLVIGFFVGGKREQKHYDSIKEREKTTRDLVAVGIKTPPFPKEKIIGQKLVMGSVVISIDHFKKFIAGLRLLIGGDLHSYESLVDRARREAILRMKSDAFGHDMIINLKVETSSISKGQKNAVGSIEVLAYGTALKIDKSN